MKTRGEKFARLAVVLGVALAGTACGAKKKMSGKAFLGTDYEKADKTSVEEDSLDGEPAYTVRANWGAKELVLTFTVEPETPVDPNRVIWRHPMSTGDRKRLDATWNGAAPTEACVHGSGDDEEGEMDITFSLRLTGSPQYDCGGGVSGSAMLENLPEAPVGPQDDRGSCKDNASGICSEIVSGDAAEFQNSCRAEAGASTYSSGKCSGSWSFQCLNAEGTSNVTGNRIVLNLYWPAGFCAQFPNLDNASTCAKLKGTPSGTPCEPPK